MGPITLNLSAGRVAQVALGGAALYGGYKVASTMVRTAYREDLLGDPTRIVEIDGKTMIYQTREAQGGKLTNFTMGAGGAAAFAGGALVLGAVAKAAAAAASGAAPAANAGIKHMLAMGGGAALFAFGMGAIAGATSMSAQFQGADFEPIR